MAKAPVWFITGGSSGFGLELAKLALSKGHTVIAAARNVDRMTPLSEAGAETVAFDVTWPLARLQEVAASVFQKHGRVDYLINAAGYLLSGSLEEATPEEIFACINTNVIGTINTFKAFVARLREQPVAENGTRATVATFGSLGSWKGAAGCGIYSMTKAAASSLGETLFEELAPFNIVGTVIEPGYFRTSFLTSNAVVHPATQLDIYSDTTTAAGQMRQALRDVSGKQPGDVVKGCAVTFDILTRTGIAEGRAVPVRIVLGRDADEFIRNKISSTLGILEDWKGPIHSTDHDDVA